MKYTKTEDFIIIVAVCIAVIFWSTMLGISFYLVIKYFG